MHHVEWLLMAKRNELEIGEFEFSGHKGERKYSIKRCLRWLIDLIKASFYNYG